MYYNLQSSSVITAFDGNYPTENYTIGYVCETPESPMNFWTLFRLGSNLTSNLTEESRN